MPALTPGEPKESPKPQPIGNVPIILLVTIIVCCLLFLLYRRTHDLKKVISHQLKTWREPDGQGPIRLSIDDGPSATEFLEDDYDDDNEHLDLAGSDSEALMRTKSTVAQANQAKIPRQPEGQSTEMV